MIIEVELVDFLSHGSTTVKFGPGMNVIVGPNGAGKSSIVEGITFALFGEHTRKVRKTNKTLIRHGNTEGYAKVVFEANGKQLEARRVIKAGGTATPFLSECRKGKWNIIAAGERKNMGESTTREIANIIGMDFKKMQIASIIRQRELDSIIHEGPKDFKTRINDIVGINDFDEADKNMAILITAFRANISERLGHDDDHLGEIKSTLEKNKDDLQNVNGERRSLAAEHAKVQSTIEGQVSELAIAEDAKRARDEMKARRTELEAYAAREGKKATAEAQEIEARAAECRARLGDYEAGGGRDAGSADALKSRISELDEELTCAGDAKRARDEMKARRTELEAYAAREGKKATAEAQEIEARAAECRARLGDYEAGGGRDAGSADALKSRISELDEELTCAGDAKRARDEMKARRTELEAYAAREGKKATAEAQEIEARAAECREHLDAASMISKIRDQLKETKEEKTLEEKALGECEKTIAVLNEQLNVAGKLSLRNGKCPVCDSNVNKLKPLYRKEHIKDEIQGVTNKNKEHKRTIKALDVKIDKGTKVERDAMAASSALETLGVSSTNDIDAMERSAAEKKMVSEMAERCAAGDWRAAAEIDGQGKTYCEAIAELEERAGQKEGRKIAEIEEELASVRRASDAATFLAAHSVKGASDIDAMERSAAEKKMVSEMAERCAAGDWRAAAEIDGQGKTYCEAIAELEERAGQKEGRKIAEIEEELASVRRASDAATFLAAHSVKGASDIDAMERSAAEKKMVSEMAERCAAGDWRAAAEIDGQGKTYCEAIAELEERANGSNQDVTVIRAELEEERERLGNINKLRGAAEQRAEKLDEDISKYSVLTKELEIVSRYVKRLEAIKNVFWRNGPVATSLRSWALDEVSRGSAEHLGLLGTRINRISLSEKDRDVTITCHSGVTTSEVYSLSGGEQICVALALRLGMARLLGSSGPSYVILDEPTAELDEERRKALAQVLTSLARSSDGSTPMQFIMITHDAEIFGEAPVERCYRFEPGTNGTVVSELTHGD